MPRDGSNIYSIPPGTEGISDTTIESTKYNNFAHDVETDLNAPRPIVAGGTGANNAAAARTNLQAEVRDVQVTNYDSHVFEHGSFWSASGATGAPNASHYFMGFCYGHGESMVLEVRPLTGLAPEVPYVRVKTTGVWGAWTVAGADQYVNVTGDTMTGPLNLTGVGHWAFGGVGSGSWYNTSTTVDKFFVGTDNSTENWRVYAIGPYINCLEVDGTTGEIKAPVAPTTGSSLANKTYVDGKIARTGDDMSAVLGLIWGFRGVSGNIIRHTWSGGSLSTEIDYNGVWRTIWDSHNSSSGVVVSGGYLKLPNGWIIQYGAHSGGGEATIYFPIAFPNSVLCVVATMLGTVASDQLLSCHTDPFPPLYAFNIRPRYDAGATFVGVATQQANWIAIGF